MDMETIPSCENIHDTCDLKAMTLEAASKRPTFAQRMRQAVGTRVVDPKLTSFPSHGFGWLWPHRQKAIAFVSDLNDIRLRPGEISGQAIE
jgi:hypothetical protein